jgi:hypothetical protein
MVSASIRTPSARFWCGADHLGEKGAFSGSKPQKNATTLN